VVIGVVVLILLLDHEFVVRVEIDGNGGLVPNYDRMIGVVVGVPIELGG
jgi:hypothetical protein